MIFSMFKPLSPRARKWISRLFFYGAALVMLGFFGIVVALRWWILPEVSNYRADIEHEISKASGHKVSIGAVSASWQGVRPHLAMSHVVLHDKQGQPALTLENVGATLSWWSVPALELRLHRFEVLRPTLEVVREKDGVFYVSGIAIDPKAPSTFSDWLLRQEDIHISHAVLTWQDNLRGALPLTLSDVGLRLENSGKRHRFGLLATPPTELASHFDVRGDLRGATLNEIDKWSGQLYANLGDTDIVSWKSWVDLPYTITQGHGGMQIWGDIDGGKLVGVTALAHLSNVRAKLARALPELELKRLSGRLSWRELPGGFVFEARRLELDAARRLDIALGNVLVRFQAAQGREPERGELRADNLAIEPLVALTEYLPLTPGQREQLKEAAPRGTFKQFQLKWDGPRDAPLHYTAKAEFERIGLRPLGKLPGFENVSGTLEADEDGGKLNLSGKQATVELPLVMRFPLTFDALTAATQWRVKSGVVELDIERAAFENADLSGTASGLYRTQPDRAGYLDLSAALTRAEGPAVSRYLPRVIGETTYEWMRTALIQGRSDDVRLKLQGDLDHFPFANDKHGLFHITAKVQGVALRYVPGWPEIEDIDALIDFRGQRMLITSSKARILGANLTRVKASIPDLLVPEELLEVDGEAQGPTAEMIRFINLSPVAGMIDDFTRETRVEGTGKLALSLRIPLRHSKDATLAGNYQFANNRIQLETGAPWIEQATGRVTFTERGLAIPRITGRLLGGPVIIDAATAADGAVRVNVNGKMTAAALQALQPGAVLNRLSGDFGYAASAAWRRNKINFTFASNLVGLGMALPPPFQKSAAQSLPLKFERKLIESGHDQIALNVGNVLSAQFERTLEGDKPVVSRGVVNVGNAPAPAWPARGVLVQANLPSIDLDAWLALADGGGDNGMLPSEMALQLRADKATVFNQVLNHADARGRYERSAWRAGIESDEISGGEISRSSPDSRVVIRAKRVRIPENGGTAQPERQANEPPPSLDVVVESLESKQVQYGKFELLATRRQKDLLIERAALTNPSGSVVADGALHGWAGKPQARLNVNVDVQDIGKLLDRLGHPEQVKGGNAKLNGVLTWRGGLNEVNLATMAGEFKLEAHNGQFLKVQPGVGRLLGLVSLQSLPRRLTLDFRDVFSDGFAFDNIEGTIKLSGGVMSTQDFSMVGPAANVSMSGNVGLIDETQNLRVKVVPGVGDSVAVATAFLGGPAVGAAALVLQRLLKDPVGQIISYEYSITGNWANPVVAKLSQAEKANP